MALCFTKLNAQQGARSGVSHDSSQPVVRNTDHTLGDLHIARTLV